MEFGPEIKVDGIRPEWLGDYNGLVKWWNADQPQGMVCDKSLKLNWGPYPGHTHGGITSFALPANHSHYTKTEAPTRTALEQRMEDFVRRVAMLNLQAASLTGTPAWNVGKEAAELRAELPEPVDPEYERAEKELTELWYAEDRFAAVVQFAVAQVERGRQLQRDAEQNKCG